MKLLKFIIASLYIILTYSNLFAQDINIKKSRIIFSVGLNSSSDISLDDNYNDSRMMFSPMAEISNSINLKGIHWLTLGIGYNQIGDIYKYYTGNNNGKTDVKIYVHTLKIPILYSLQLEKGKKANFFMRLGPSLDYVLGKSTIKAKEALNNEDRFRKNISQGFVTKHNLVLMNFGIGINLKNGAGDVTNNIELVYSGIAKNIFYTSSSSDESKYQMIALKFGIAIPNY